MSAKVKKVRKTSVAIEKLNKILSQLEFFYKNRPEWKSVKEDAEYIEKHILDLSIEKKIDHARLAKKFKHLTQSNKKQVEEENKKLKKVIEELKND